MFPISRQVLVASTAFAAVMSVAVPLHAQRRQGGSERAAGQAQARSGAVSRSEGREQAPPQQPPSQRQAPRPAPQAQPPARQQESPRRGDDTRSAPPQGRVSRDAPSSRNGYGPQGSYQSPQSSRGYGNSSSRAVPYGGYARRPVQVRRPVFVQPYYSFRSRLTLGFGLHVGYSVAYPFQYYDPYGFYNYRSVAPVYGPSARSYGSSYYYNRVGGLSFDIDPYDAALFIDGEYVGVADDFASDQMPLTMPAGRHRIELRAQGFMPVSFEITVIAGQVIPYEGTLPYIR